MTEAPPESNAGQPAGPPFEITVATLDEWRQQQRGFRMLDVREPWEREICGFAEAIAIPLGSLHEHLEDLPDGDDLVVICHHGQRSAMATRFLRAQGFDRATNLGGGMDAWARQIDPAMAVY